MDALPDGIIGTDPKYPSIVDHSWLAVDKAQYDNYPSDNNPVRVQPKLSELWDPMKNCSFGLIPNQNIKPLGVMSSEEEKSRMAEAVTDVIREAKKAAMAGMGGKEISQHLRSRFSAKHIEAASEELKKIAEEVGLLGNVYIDSSAFRTVGEADSFLAQNRNRLAQNMLVDATLNESQMRKLASKFHKTVVSKVIYDEALYEKYRNHLSASGHIPADFVIDSKESLRKAFLYQPAPEPKKIVASQPKKVLSKEEIAAGLSKLSEKKSADMAEADQSISWEKAHPVVEFVQQCLSAGKKASDIKEMLRHKYSRDSIESASEYLPILLSKGGLSLSGIDAMVKEGGISYKIGSDLKKMAQRYPVRISTVPEIQKKQSWSGVKAFFHSLRGKKASDDPMYIATMEALRKGCDISKIRSKLMEKTSFEKANDILNSAVSDFNASPAGVTANSQKKSSSKIIIEDTRKVSRLPDPSTIPGQLKEIADFYKGANTDIEIDPPFSGGVSEIEISGSSSELDKML